MLECSITDWLWIFLKTFNRSSELFETHSFLLKNRVSSKISKFFRFHYLWWCFFSTITSFISRHYSFVLFSLVILSKRDNVSSSFIRFSNFSFTLLFSLDAKSNVWCICLFRALVSLDDLFLDRRIRAFALS
jgi:hypothetical protein